MTDYEIIEERDFENSEIEIPTIVHEEGEGDDQALVPPIDGSDLLLPCHPARR